MRVLFLALFAMLLALPAFAQAPINVNTATADQLDALPGIGPSKAEAIVQHRDENGAFATLNDLDAVPGIGPATLSNLAPLVIFSDDGTPAAAPAAEAPASSGGAPAASSSSAPAGAIDINSASAEALQGLPGIGPSKAAAIVADRDQNGAFSSCDDLTRVHGIGAATVSLLAGQCAAQ